MKILKSISAIFKKQKPSEADKVRKQTLQNSTSIGKYALGYGWYKYITPHDNSRG